MTKRCIHSSTPPRNPPPIDPRLVTPAQLNSRYHDRGRTFRTEESAREFAARFPAPVWVTPLLKGMGANKLHAGWLVTLSSSGTLPNDVLESDGAEGLEVSGED